MLFFPLKSVLSLPPLHQILPRTFSSSIISLRAAWGRCERDAVARHSSNCLLAAAALLQLQLDTQATAAPLQAGYSCSATRRLQLQLDTQATAAPRHAGYSCSATRRLQLQLDTQATTKPTLNSSAGVWSVEGEEFGAPKRFFWSNHNTTLPTPFTRNTPITPTTPNIQITSTLPTFPPLPPLPTFSPVPPLPPAPPLPPLSPLPPFPPLLTLLALPLLPPLLLPPLLPILSLMQLQGP
ncbi:hypothetical protein FHG87_005861 [Trinorchestia longiramus]|nr:hypothetical protein FHG87_005861 [Trinorchestia longiramus]